MHPPILRALPKLQYLSLAYNAITDSGLAFLEGCPKLQSLTLSFNKITDFGLVYLEGLPKLQSLEGAIPKRGDFDSTIRSLPATTCDKRVEDPRSAFNFAGKIHLLTTVSGWSSTPPS